MQTQVFYPLSLKGKSIVWLCNNIRKYKKKREGFSILLGEGRKGFELRWSLTIQDNINVYNTHTHIVYTLLNCRKKEQKIELLIEKLGFIFSSIHDLYVRYFLQENKQYK